MELLIRNWFSKPATNKTLHIPDGLSTSSVLSLKAEHIDAYRTGHAFAYAIYEWDCFPHYQYCSSLALGRVAYADGVMAWIDTADSHSVKSLDLRTGQEWSFLPEARTRITAIAMSSSMIAVLGSGRCHVWNFRGGDRYLLQLPSNGNQKIFVSGGTLAIVARRWQTGEPESTLRYDAVTWTVKGQRTSSFCVDLPSKRCEPSAGVKIMLDNNGESLLFFEGVIIPGFVISADLTHFHYIRTSLDGDVLTQGVLEVPNTEDYEDCSDYTELKEVDGEAVIWSYAHRQHDWDNFSELMTISYNFRKDRLEVRTQEVAGLRFVNSEALLPSLFHWKDAAYFFNRDPDDGLGLRVIDLQESTCSKAKMDFALDSSLFDVPHKETGPTAPGELFFGDETFLISVFQPGFCVWCFDANVPIFKEEIDYKEERKSNIERRLRLRIKEKQKNTSSDDTV